VIRAETLERLGEARRLVLVDALYPQLERGDRTRAECFAETVRELPPTSSGEIR
jgi:thioesterase domain-containing protein